MRKIKFRVWQGGSFKYWGFIGQAFIGAIGENSIEPLSIEEIHSRCQEFTGLYDKNGKEIYEGDIVVMEMVYNGKKGTKTYHNQMKTILWIHTRAYNGFNLAQTQNRVVVGNIFQNPEMLRD